MVKKELNKRCLSNEECKSKLCFQGICTSKKSLLVSKPNLTNNLTKRKSYIDQRATKRKALETEIRTKIKNLKAKLGRANKTLTKKNKELDALTPNENNTPKKKLDKLETEIKSVKKTIKSINHLKNQQTQKLNALTRKIKKKDEKEKKKHLKFKKEMKHLSKAIIPREGDKCAICLDQIQPHEAIIDCVNEHTFHNGCIQPICSQRKKTDRKCPNCRGELNCFSYPSPLPSVSSSDSPAYVQTPSGTPPFSDSDSDSPPFESRTIAEFPRERLLIHRDGYILDASSINRPDYIDLLNGDAQIDDFEEDILNNTATEKTLGEVILHLIDNVYEIPHNQVQVLVDFARDSVSNRAVVECSSPDHHWIYDKEKLIFLYDYHYPFLYDYRDPRQKELPFLFLKIMGRLRDDGLTQEIQDFFLSKTNLETPLQPNKWYYDTDGMELWLLKYYPEINALIDYSASNEGSRVYNTDLRPIRRVDTNNFFQELDKCLIEDAMPEHLLNDLRDKLPEKHFKQKVQVVVVANPNLSGTYILDINSREMIYSSPSTEPPIDVNWETVHRNILTRYGNGV